MIFPAKKEVLTLSEFLAPQPSKPTQSKKPLNTSIYSFFPPITISSFFPVLSDPTFGLFVIGCGLITIVGFAEYVLALSGNSEISAYIAGISKVVFPIIGYGLLFWFLLSL